MKKTIISIIALTLVALWASAATGVIAGKLVDATDTSALEQGSVRLMKANKDSTYVNSTTADSAGLFLLRDVPAGHYYVKFGFLGYDDRTLKVAVDTSGRMVNMGVIRLTPNSIMLKEAVVTGVKTPIIVKEDTIEYNADTYKTQANAVVEDLLKRLPGVEVGSDGSITANGKTVSKILVDGEEFFSDDVKVGSKNIPANIVDKLQVVDRKSDLARLTGVDDGEDETVINLTIKKGMKNGWFGNANVGYGTDDRYKGNLMANYFRDKNQFTILGGFNNTNEPGFTDGGMSRFQRFGGNSGVNKSGYGGVNFNVGEDKGLRVGGSVMYSHNKRNTYSTNSRQYLFPDSSSYYNSASNASDRTDNVRGDFRLRWVIDTLSTLEFRPNFSFNFSKSVRSDSSMTRAGDAALSPVNRSVSDYDNHGNSCEFGGELVFNHNFASHPGRSYSAQLRYNYSNVHEDGNTFTQNHYYLRNDSDATIDQIYKNHRWSNGVNGRLTWTEPLGSIRNARFLTAGYSARYNVSNSDKMVYDITRATSATTTTTTPELPYVNSLATLVYDNDFRKAIANEYTSYALTDGNVLAMALGNELGSELERALNEDQSNSYRNHYFNQSFQLGFRQVRSKYNLDAGFAVNGAMQSGKDLMNSARNIDTQWAWSVAPYMRLRFKFSKTENLSIDYRMRASQPSLTQLQPVADVSNPLNITVGNPDLKPTFTHRFNLRYSNFGQESQRSIMAMINGNYEQNSIINTVTYDPTTGGRLTSYDNVNGVWSLMGGFMFSQPFRNKSFYFTSNLFSRFNRAVGYNNSLLNRSSNFSINVSPGIAYRTDLFDIELRPRYNFQTTHNSVNTLNHNNNIHTYGGQFNAQYSAPFGLVVGTDLSYSATSGYSAGYNTKQWLWNGSIAYQFLRDKQAAFTLNVYDILKQRKSINRNVTASYIEDAFTNSLGRYAMLTFSYRFTTFKKGETPEGGFDRDEYRRGVRGGRPGPPPGVGGPGGRRGPM